MLFLQYLQAQSLLRDKVELIPAHQLQVALKL